MFLEDDRQKQEMSELGNQDSQQGKDRCSHPEDMSSS